VLQRLNHVLFIIRNGSGCTYLGGMSFTCPWLCVTASSTLSPVVTTHHKSFAAALGGNVSPTDDVPLPVPCIKGDSLSIRIGQEEYVKVFFFWDFIFN